MVGVNDTRGESADSRCGLAHRHREWYVHANEGDIDVLKRAHFRYVPGISTHVEALAANGDHIPITVAFRVIAVVGGYCLDGETHDICDFSIVEHNGQILKSRGHAVVNGPRGNDHDVGSSHGVQSRGVEVIAVAMTDEDQVRARKALVGGGTANRIVIDQLPIPAHDEARVIDRMENDLAVGSGEVITGQNGRAANWQRTIKTGGEIRGASVGMLDQAGAAKGCEGDPIQEVRRGIDPVIESCRGALFEENLFGRKKLNLWGL